MEVNILTYSASPPYGVYISFYEEAYFYNRRLTLTFKGMETRYRYLYVPLNCWLILFVALLPV
jgi:hypothetical protein